MAATRLQDKPTEIGIGPFPAGMNTRQPDHALPEGALRNAVNTDIDIAGFLSRRDGYEKIFTGLGTHSGWSCPLWTLFVDAGLLKRLNADNTATVLMPVSGVVCYHFFNNVVYFSDGIGAYKLLANGTIRNWGVVPPTAPMLSAAAGALPAGTYLGALTFIGSDGIEHGSSDVVAIDIPDNKSIVFSLPTSSDPQVAYVRVYMSSTNGSTLYGVADVPVGSTSYTATALGQGRELDTLGVTNMVAGSAIDEYNGRLYVKAGSSVWHTDYLAPDRLRPSTNFLLFNTSVAVMAAVPKGLWIVADKTYMYRGNGPGDFSIEIAADYGAAQGVVARIPNSTDVMWYSDRGIVRAGDALTNLQESNVAAESGSDAAMIVRERDGLIQAVASVQNAVISPLVSQSFLTMEVIRKAA